MYGRSINSADATAQRIRNENEPMQKHTHQPASSSATAAPAGGLLQRACACGNHTSGGGECESCQQRRLQRFGTEPAPDVAPPIVHEVLRTPGQPLDPAARAALELRFGHNFSGVRVHTDAQAAVSAQAVNALAYTVGSHVAFGSGQYTPGTPAGDRLIAHELTHVVQQQGATQLSAPIPLEDSKQFEAAAEQAEHGVPALQSQGQAPIALQRKGGTFAGFFANIGRAIAGLFGAEPEYDQQTLQQYLQVIDAGDIEGDFDSDNKARAVVRAAQRGSAGFDLTVKRKILLIRELSAPFYARDDEAAVIAILEDSDHTEMTQIFGSGGVNPAALKSLRFKQFCALRFEGGMEAVLQGRLVEKRGGLQRYDPAAVALARHKLPLLYRFVDEWQAREARRLRMGLERTEQRERRRKMDEEGEPLGQYKSQLEAQRIADLNRRPLTISVDADTVRIQVRFHVMFEDQTMTGRLAELRQSLRDATRLIWNQQLSDALDRRRFVVETTLTNIAPNATRNQDFWLIVVRQANTGPVNYPGCQLDQPPPGAPTSVTDSACDGGVMSIPPRHIDMPDILGHEMMHLFGLLDRYLMITSPGAGPRGQTVVETTPTRETGGRRDPLGGETGTILREDLSFLFDRLGIYTMAENEGLATLQRLEDQGMGIDRVRVEIERLETIVRLGYDPNSLIRVRENFNDRMLRSAEDLD
jgi:hypothetical protein